MLESRMVLQVPGIVSKPQLCDLTVGKVVWKNTMQVIKINVKVCVWIRITRCSSIVWVITADWAAEVQRKQLYGSESQAECIFTLSYWCEKANTLMRWVNKSNDGKQR